MKELKSVLEKRRKEKLNLVVILGFVLVLISLNFILAAVPAGPDTITSISNETKPVSSSGEIFNISGGYISNFNLTASIQNTRWKAFVGNVIGSFTLDDASSSTIYDWTISTLTGRVYATRNSSTINWASINCSNLTYLNQENVAMNHTNADDNLNQTFDYSTGTHSTFWVGTTQISANQCPTLNTYRNNVTQDSYFEEMALYDGASHVFATIMEEDEVGYDGTAYDFQMIVPENGLPSFTGATAYYLYVELGN